MINQVHYNLRLFQNPSRNGPKEVGARLKGSKELAVLFKARHSINKNIMATTAMGWVMFSTGEAGREKQGSREGGDRHRMYVANSFYIINLSGLSFAARQVWPRFRYSSSSSERAHALPAFPIRYITSVVNPLTDTTFKQTSQLLLFSLEGVKD